MISINCQGENTIPEHIKHTLRVAGGLNTWGEPNFRIVWGAQRIVPITGLWQDFEPSHGTGIYQMTAKGLQEIKTRPKLIKSVVETRHVPKYLPKECFFLEKWCPPEMYGSPETWGKLGEEVVGSMTVDTAGPFPSRGEYELVFPLTSDHTPLGTPIPLYGAVIEMIVGVIQQGRNFSHAQRRAAIQQRVEREDEQYIDRTEAILRDGLRPFGGEKFIVVPGGN